MHEKETFKGVLIVLYGTEFNDSRKSWSFVILVVSTKVHNGSTSQLQDGENLG